MTEKQQVRGVALDRSEGFGERLLGTLLDRGHEMPHQLIAPLVAEEVNRVGGRQHADEPGGGNSVGSDASR